MRRPSAPRLEPRDYFRLSDGCVLSAPPRVPFRVMFREIVERGCYLPSAGFRVGPGELVLDIGANVGLFSIWASWGAPSARFLAFEAARDNFLALAENVRVNRLELISAHHCAVTGGGSPHATLYRGFHGGIHSIRPEYRNQGPGAGRRETERVRASSLAGILRRFRLARVDLMKLDCEGAEYEILFRAPPAALSRVRRIVGEYHDLGGERRGRVLRRFLERSGFKTALRAAGPGKPWGMFAAASRLEPAPPANPGEQRSPG